MFGGQSRARTSSAQRSKQGSIGYTICKATRDSIHMIWNGARGTFLGTLLFIKFYNSPINSTPDPGLPMEAFLTIQIPESDTQSGL